MSKFETSLSESADCNLTLYHDPEDPLSWVLKKWKKQLFWKRCELSRWFATREQAEAYAEKLIRASQRAQRLGN